MCNSKAWAVEGYDNVKKKFVASWIDNMGTGIQFSEGTYDPATKTFTYTSEMESVPGMKTQVREVLKVAGQQPYDAGMVREPGRPGKEDDGDQLHARRQEIARHQLHTSWKPFHKCCSRLVASRRSSRYCSPREHGDTRHGGQALPWLQRRTGKR